MRDWHLSDEFEQPVWVFDLDDATYSVAHRRLCVWPDEFDGRWHWEIQTYDDGGAAASGSCGTLDEARQAAMAAARPRAVNPARGDRR